MAQNGVFTDSEAMTVLTEGVDAGTAPRTLTGYVRKSMKNLIMKNMLFGRECRKPVRWEYLSCSVYFEDQLMMVRPTQEEIDEGFLFPADRFQPFYAPGISGHELKLLSDCGEALSNTVHSFKISSISDYFTFSSPRQISWYMNSNQAYRQAFEDKEELSNYAPMTVFDCKKLFKQLELKPGDGLIFKVKSWMGGELEFVEVCREGEMIPFADIHKYVDKMDSIMEKVFKKWGVLPASRLALSFCLYEMGLELPCPMITLPEWLRRSSKVSLYTVKRCGMLWHKGRSPREDMEEPNYAFQVPEGPCCNSELSLLLQKHGAWATSEHLKSIMINRLSVQNEDFDDLMQVPFRAKDECERPTVEEAPELYKMATELWQELKSHYSPFNDNLMRTCRTNALKMRVDIQAFIHHLIDEGIGMDEIPEDEGLTLENAIEGLDFYISEFNNPRVISETEFAEYKENLLGLIGSCHATVEDIYNKL